MVIALTGFMASGKSSVGEALSTLLGYRFVDLDKYIVHKAGKSITDIFLEGEDRFRALEAEALRDNVIMSQVEGFDLVLALGGGTIINPESRNLLKSDCKCFYLKASKEELQKRLSECKEERPMLQKSSLEQLLSQRLPLYEKAGIMIDTDSKTPKQTAQEIRNLL